jgi:rubrerythrin
LNIPRSNFLLGCQNGERIERGRGGSWTGGCCLLREQMEVEGKLIDLYDRTASNTQNKPVRHLLHTIRLDSLKHIDICQTVLEIL